MMQQNFKQFTLVSRTFGTAIQDFWKYEQIGDPVEVSQICCSFICFFSLKQIYSDMIACSETVCKTHSLLNTNDFIPAFMWRHYQYNNSSRHLRKGCVLRVNKIFSQVHIHNYIIWNYYGSCNTTYANSFSLQKQHDKVQQTNTM